MPARNNFRHQPYDSDPPGAPFRVIEAAPPPPPGSTEYAARMHDVGARFRRRGVSTILLVHGTFAGTDAFGLFRLLAPRLPGVAEWLRGARKSAFDRVSRDVGNYTEGFASEFERAASVAVRRFHWSSENHHLGRADAAVRLCDELLSRAPTERILLWGHSHAGNVFALLSNLLGADRDERTRFLDAGRAADPRIWDRVRDRLDATAHPPALDVATFGTPIRYGWDPGPIDALLHVVHHRPVAGLPAYLTRFPPTVTDVTTAASGDCMQQLGLAGTNLPPSIFWFRAWRADRRLGHLLEAGLRARGLIDRLQTGMRVARDGETLLVDYGPIPGHVHQHLAGHAIYTDPDWLLFHAEAVVNALAPPP